VSHHGASKDVFWRKDDARINNTKIYQLYEDVFWLGLIVVGCGYFVWHRRSSSSGATQNWLIHRRHFRPIETKRDSK
jgi:hypothetical protein